MGKTDRKTEGTDMKEVVKAIESEYREMLKAGKQPVAIAVDPETFVDLCKELNTHADVGVNFLLLCFPLARIPVIKDCRYIKCII